MALTNRVEAYASANMPEDMPEDMPEQSICGLLEYSERLLRESVERLEFLTVGHQPKPATPATAPTIDSIGQYVGNIRELALQANRLSNEISVRLGAQL